MTEKYDAIIIGTGQAGPSLAARLTKEGMRAAIIERKLFGGTCVNVGCIPTKTLVASARAAYMARRAADFGVSIDGPITVDMKRVKARKDAVVRQSNEGVESWLKKMPNLSVYEGHARFESANTVRVGDALVEAGKIFINVGARAHVPDMPGLGDVDYLTNTSIGDLYNSNSTLGVEIVYERLVGEEVSIYEEERPLGSLGLPETPDDLEGCVGLTGASSHDQEEPVLAFGNGFEAAVDRLGLVVTGFFAVAVFVVGLENEFFFVSLDITVFLVAFP